MIDESPGFVWKMLIIINYLIMLFKIAFQIPWIGFENNNSWPTLFGLLKFHGLSAFKTTGVLLDLIILFLITFQKSIFEDPTYKKVNKRAKNSEYKLFHNPRYIENLKAKYINEWSTLLQMQLGRQRRIMKLEKDKLEAWLDPNKEFFIPTWLMKDVSSYLEQLREKQIKQKEFREMESMLVESTDKLITNDRFIDFDLNVVEDPLEVKKSDEIKIEKNEPSQETESLSPILKKNDLSIIEEDFETSSPKHEKVTKKVKFIDDFSEEEKERVKEKKEKSKEELGKMEIDEKSDDEEDDDKKIEGEQKTSEKIKKFVITQLDKFISWCHEDTSKPKEVQLTYDSEDESEFLRTHSSGSSNPPEGKRLYQLVSGLFKLISNNTMILVYLAIILNQTINANLLSLVFVVSIFGYSVMLYPEPKKKFWVFLLGYNVFVIWAKVLYQISFFCNCYSRGGSFWGFGGDCKTEICCSEYSNLLSYPYLIGIYKYSGIILVSLIPDLLVLISLLVHRSFLRRKGIWLDAIKFFTEIKLEENGKRKKSTPLISLKRDYKSNYFANQLDEEKSPIEVIERDPNKNKNYFKIIYNHFVEHHEHLAETYLPLEDYYVYTLVSEFLCFFLIVFFPSSFTGVNCKKIFDFILIIFFALFCFILFYFFCFIFIFCFIYFFFFIFSFIFYF